MNRRTLLKGMGGAVAAAALESSTAWAKPAQKRPPNVIFILPDEWRAEALGCMDNPDVKTPHIDQLAAEGVLMRNTFANTPVCCPARAVMLTGTYTSTNGMIANDLRLDESKITLGDLFSQAGYRTGYIGKWHLDGGPREPGFIPPGRRRHGFQFWAANECNHNYFHSQYFRDTDVPIVSTKYEPELWTDVAIDFLHQTHDQPFFLMLSIGAPHDPYKAPEKYMKMYDPAKLTMEPNWVPGIRGAERTDIAAYYGCCTAIDDQVGRLMDTLRTLGLDENTIVFFSSDHGNMLGSQGKILKRKPWEESIRVPGIMRCPSLLPKKKTSEALFSHVDYAPTLLSLCGINPPSDMQGTNQAQVITGKQDQATDAAYFQIFGPYHAGGVDNAWRAIRTDRYMYARTQEGPWLFYDLHRDPYEQKNLIDDASAQSVMEKLDANLLAWMKHIGDSWSLDWTAPIEDGGRLYTHGTFHTVPEYMAWAAKHPDLAKLPATH